VTTKKAEAVAETATARKVREQLTTEKSEIVLLESEQCSQGCSLVAPPCRATFRHTHPGELAPVLSGSLSLDWESFSTIVEPEGRQGPGGIQWVCCDAMLCRSRTIFGGALKVSEPAE